MTVLYVDADACPVKDEIFRVARRHGLKARVVANALLRVPEDCAECVVVSGDFDAADDWIAERAGRGDVLVTADLPLADRCLKNGARVLTAKGKEFTLDSIAGALASRQLMEQLRQMGQPTGGPAPFGPKDRSRFLEALERVLQAAKREAGAPP